MADMRRHLQNAIIYPVIDTPSQLLRLRLSMKHARALGRAPKVARRSFFLLAPQRAPVDREETHAEMGPEPRPSIDSWTDSCGVPPARPWRTWERNGCDWNARARGRGRPGRGRQFMRDERTRRDGGHGREMDPFRAASAFAPTIDPGHVYCGCGTGLAELGLRVKEEPVALRARARRWRLSLSLSLHRRPSPAKIPSDRLLSPIPHRVQPVPPTINKQHDDDDDDAYTPAFVHHDPHHPTLGHPSLHVYLFARHGRLGPPRCPPPPASCAGRPLPLLARRCRRLHRRLHHPSARPHQGPASSDGREEHGLLAQEHLAREW